jgi:hypothetical protein
MQMFLRSFRPIPESMSRSIDKFLGPACKGGAVFGRHRVRGGTRMRPTCSSAQEPATQEFR